MSKTPKRRPRGKGKPLADKMAAMTDRDLLHLLQHGRPVLDPSTGLPAMIDGKPVMRRPTAAELTAIIRRLGQLEANAASAKKRPADLVGEAARRFAQRSTLNDSTNGPELR